MGFINGSHQGCALDDTPGLEPVLHYSLTVKPVYTVTLEKW